MRIFFKSIILLAICAGFLFFMQKLGLLRIADILTAFERRPLILILLIFVQFLASFLMMIRYGTLLSVLGIKASWKQISSATFVSAAIGQWVPGSLAVVEILRVGLMVGSQSDHSHGGPQQADSVGVKSRLAIASFADRLIGFLGILLVGFVFSFYLVLQPGQSDKAHGLRSGVGFLFLSSGLGTFALLALPFLVRLKFLKSFGRRLKVQGISTERLFFRIWNIILRHLEVLRHNIDAGSRHPGRLLRPLLLSMTSLLLTSLSLYLSAFAIGDSLDFLQIVCAYPLISLSALLPLGFAGIGGYQLIMASIFSLFSVSPAIVASAGVLQSAVVLVVNTFIGLLYARVCSQQIRAILKRPEVAESL